MANNPTEICEILVSGVRYSQWKTVSVKRALDAIAASFEVTASNVLDAPLPNVPAFPGDEVQVFLAGELIITGYIETRQGAFDANDHGLQFQGRTKTGDMVDSSADEEGGQFENTTLSALASRICSPFGITVKSSSAAAFRVIRDCSIIPGETAWEFLERHARISGLSLTDTPEGELHLFGEGQSGGASIREGENVLSANVVFTSAGRNSKAVTKGQRQSHDEFFGADASEVEAT
jgi:prophage tail gpP-like protein